MKRVLKKTFAMALTIAMVMSLGVSALASNNNVTTYQTASGSTLSGSVVNEGPLPTEVLKFVVSTLETDTFNLIVDPHDLIRLSTAAEKAKSDYANKSFESGAYAFFKNKDDDEAAYRKESTSLTVINKSTTPITVDLDAKLNSNPGGSNAIDKIALVDTEEELATLTKKAGLYLAVKQGETETPVSQNSVGDITVAIPDALKDYIIGAKFEWITADNVTSGQTVASNKTKKAFSEAIATSDLPVTITNATSSTAGDGKIKIAAPTAANPAWGATSATTGIGSDIEQKLVDTVTSNTRVLTLTYPESGKAVQVARITFYFDMDKVMNTSTGTPPTGNVTLTKWDGKPYADVSVQTSKHATAYTVQSTASGYEYVLDQTIDNEDFPKQSFNLKAAINRDDAWDTVGGGSISNAINVTWNVHAYLDPSDPLLTVDEAGLKNGEVAKVSFTGGKGEYKVKDLLNVSYTTVENGNTKVTTVDKNGKDLKLPAAITATGAGQFELTVATKMIAEGVPETMKAAFLMVSTNDATKVMVKEVAFDCTKEG